MIEGKSIKSFVAEIIMDTISRFVPIRQIKLNTKQYQSLESLTDKNIAILIPHPDDEVIGCFHFIQQFGAQTAIDLFYVTEDHLFEIAEIRRSESMSATSALNIRERSWWHYVDGNLTEYRNELQKRLLDLVNNYDVILCLSPDDRTPDHTVLAEEAYNTIPHEKLLWYRSTWLTFPLYEADLVIQGEPEGKRVALRYFKSQKQLALQNVISFSALEAKKCGFRSRSIEGFRFASSGQVSLPPINVLSIKAAWNLRAWR